MKKIAIIKCFTHKGKNYLYDTYTNRLCEISKALFVEIMQMQKVGVDEYFLNPSNSSVYHDIKWLYEKGMLKKSFVSEVEHIETKYVTSLVRNCINDLTLQVTRDCNFKCRYCLYAAESGVERQHEKINMEWETARQAIDFLFLHSKSSNEVKVSFYGGEPLLNFEIIKKSVEYAESLFQIKQISYSITTNGALLSEEIVDFFKAHKFDLTISLDGPKNIQDYHRKFVFNGEGTFDVVYNNILLIKRKYEDYFKNHVTFNPVFFEGESIAQAFNVFEELDVSPEKVFFRDADMSGIDHYKRRSTTNDKNQAVELYEKKSEITLIESFNNRAIIPEKWHHPGPCIPAFKFLFVDINGVFYPCEKLIENSTFAIGNLEDGISIDKVVQFLNIGKLTEKQCKSCWAIRFCNLCISHCIDIDKNELTSVQKSISCKNQKDIAINFLKKYIDEGKYI